MSTPWPERRQRRNSQAGGKPTPDRGRFVGAILACTGAEPRNPWCAAFGAYVGSGVLGRRWPLPPSASCDVVRLAAEPKGMIVGTPERGDPFFVMKNAHDAVHVGFVALVDPVTGTFGTVEGNTNDGGSREGDGVCCRRRGGPKDETRYLFVRWRDAIRPA